MFNTCPWSCPMTIQLLPSLVLVVGCGWETPARALLGWEMRMWESIGPLSFLNVTGRVQKAMAEQGEAFPWVCSPRECVPMAGTAVGCAPVPPPCTPGLPVQTAAPAWAPAKPLRPSGPARIPPQSYSWGSALSARV